jgi:hypothetical protein
MFVFRKEIKAMGVSLAKTMSSTFTMFKACSFICFKFLPDVSQYKLSKDSVTSN